MRGGGQKVCFYLPVLDEANIQNARFILNEIFHLFGSVLGPWRSKENCEKVHHYTLSFMNLE